MQKKQESVNGFEKLNRKHPSHEYTCFFNSKLNFYNE